MITKYIRVIDKGHIIGRATITADDEDGVNLDIAEAESSLLFWCACWALLAAQVET